MVRKGILLAGGEGTRLYPVTQAVSKQLLPIYDKPMIYYPLSVLMSIDVRDVLLISGPRELELFRGLLGNGDRFGMRIDYAEQAHPNGIPEAFLIAEKFLSGAPVALILGDNLFHGMGLSDWMIKISAREHGATIFSAPVSDPERYGIVAVDKNGAVVDITEKPAHPMSRQAITGLYMCDNRAVEIAKSLEPSARGETEMTDLLRRYLAEGELHVESLSRGMAWLDTGTPDALLDASNYVATMERRQGMKVACIEEIAWRKGWINSVQVKTIADSLGNIEYASYLHTMTDNNRK